MGWPMAFTPQRGQGRRSQLVAEGHEISAVIQYDAKGKSVLACLGQCAQPSEMAEFQRRGRLHLDADHHGVKN